MRVVLLATYELGRQPFGLASPAAWLRQAGATVQCQDLSRSRLDREAILAADLVAFYHPHAHRNADCHPGCETRQDA